MTKKAYVDANWVTSALRVTRVMLLLHAPPLKQALKIPVSQVLNLL
jgi:hypothetical protein